MPAQDQLSCSHLSSPPLNFALVGCGAIAPTQAKALEEIPEFSRLTHCCDLVPERANLFAQSHGLIALSWEALLQNKQIDVITICTPSGLHGQLAKQALQAGKHVMVEKPMEVSTRECDDLLAVARTSGRRLGVISQHRFDPASQAVRRLADDGAFGRLIAVDVRIPWYRTQEYYDSGDWRGTMALDGGGCLMNQGVHTVDLMLWLCGPVLEVYARTATAAHDRIEVEDLVCATLFFKNGALGTLFASTALYPGFPARLGLHGTEGCAILEGDELHTVAIRGRNTITGASASAHALQVATGGTRSAVHHAAIASNDAHTWKWGDAHRAQFVDFIASVRGGRDPLVDGEAGRNAVALIQAVYESARSGSVVRL
jgi:predicted dehydrogenase